MASTVFYIRHMVCAKCILVVREHLLALGLTPLRVELGEVEVRTAAAAIDWPRLRQSLAAEGFEILDHLSPPQRLVAHIKAFVADLLRTNPAALRSGHFSKRLSQQLSRRFTYLSDVFSAAEGYSLEQYVIRQRIGAARHLLATSTLPVGRIARALGFSSLGHLSRQFQREMGISPSGYRRGGCGSPALSLDNQYQASGYSGIANAAD
ncbi:hypothetical protein A0257_21150 [Hymenobacter psoromatis]|nr:hypothetical protein A0257_21150 [Hymenobacter psoromatis]